MPVIQISKVIHCLGTSGELPDRLELGQLGMTTDTGDVLIGAQGLPQVAGRLSYPYQNLKILTELDVQKTMTGDVYHHGPLYKQDMITATGVMDVPLFMKDPNQVAQYGVYDYSFTSTQTSQMGQVNVALNGTTPHITTTAYVWGLIQPTTFSFTALLLGEQVMMRVSWNPSDLGQEIYRFHLAGREWSAIVDTSPDSPPPPKPLPTRVLDLSALAMSPTTVQLAYTNADGAVAHEYRINGGAVNPMPNGKLITGLNPSTSYNFEVRGVNANGNGPWSNVAAATTPGVIQSYADSWNVRQGQSLTVAAPGVLTNDTNAFGLSMTAELVSNVTHGTLTLNSNGGFVYVPTSSYSGTDSFTYRPWDGTRYGSPATVTLTVQADTAPVAVTNTYSVNQGNVLNVVAPGLLGNDTDAENDALTAQMVQGTNSGVLTINADGSFRYAPFTNYIGTDMFQYRVFDGVKYSDPVWCSIVVNQVGPVNQTPISVNDTYSLTQDTVLSVAAPGLLANDYDPDGQAIYVAVHSSPLHGALTLQSNGAFTYTPSAGYVGTDTFRYGITDGISAVVAPGGTTVTLNVNAAIVNTAPVAAADSYTVSEDQTLAIPSPGVLQNDTDAQGDALTAILVSNVSHGSLTLNPGGGFSYTPSANYNGPDSFTYKANDGHLDSSTVTVNITVVPVDDPDQFVNVANKSVTNTTTTMPSSAAWSINPTGALATGLTTAATTTYGNWLINTIDGTIHHPEAYEIRASTSDVSYTHGGMALGVWNNLGSTRTLSITSSTAGYASVSFLIEIRPVNGNIINTATITLVVDTSAAIPPGGDAGGGGGGGCVWTAAYLADNSLAGASTVGHPLSVLDESGLAYHADTVRQVTFGPQPCATLITESGITLTCSYSTPIAIRYPDGHVDTIKLEDCVGEEVPVLDNGDFRYERVINYVDAGVRSVALINVNDGIYAAGNEENRFIFTHNVLNSVVSK